MLGDVCKLEINTSIFCKMFKNSVYISLITFFVLFNACSALYFHIGETERKCFIEEIPDETNVVG